MSREQAKQQLINFGVAEPTEEQITNLLNAVKTEVDTEKVKAEQYKTDAGKYVAAQEELDTLKAQGMSDVEKALAQAKKAQEDAEILKLDYARKSNQIEVEKIFVGAGLTTDDYGGFIGGIVGDDLEKSTTLAKSFADTISKQRESAVAQAKKDLLNNTDDPSAGEGGQGEGKTEDVLNAEKIAGTLLPVGEQTKTAFENY